MARGRCVQLARLETDLARCDVEIERIKRVLRAGLEPGPGAGILGLHDWFYERQLILKEIKEWQNTQGHAV